MKLYKRKYWKTINLLVLGSYIFFFSAYILHYHNIDFDTSNKYNIERNIPAGTQSYFVGNEYSCIFQVNFNSIHNYNFSNQNFSSEIILLEEGNIFISRSFIPSKTFLLLNKLRAPPFA